MSAVDYLADYLACFRTTTEAIEFEDQCLALPDLPDCAKAIKDNPNNPGSPEYYLWLISQIKEAQNQDATWKSITALFLAMTLLEETMRRSL